MRTHTISVTVENDRIQVTPDPLVMFKTDEACWAGTNARRFSIEFDGDGPFGSRTLAHEVATGVQTPIAKGRFKYTVVSEENPGLRLDPIIIVDEPPSSETI